MLDMTGFEYKDRNTIEFTGAFGKVELMFFEMVTETDELGEDRIIMSHFVPLHLLARQAFNTEQLRNHQGGTP